MVGPSYFHVVFTVLAHASQKNQFNSGSEGLRFSQIGKWIHGESKYFRKLAAPAPPVANLLLPIIPNQLGAVHASASWWFPNLAFLKFVKFCFGHASFVLRW
jgi:hypothetical protein